MAISFLKTGYNTDPVNGELISYLNLVKTGSQGLKKQIDEIRNTKEKRLLRSLKMKLPTILLSGVFSGGTKASDLKEYSGFIQVDIDKLKDPGKVKAKLILDPYSFAVFISPGGKGVKAIVRTKYPASKHVAVFDNVKAYYQSTYDLEIDKSCRNVNRKMFASYDPDLFVNQEAKYFGPLEKTKPPEKKPIPSNGDNDDFIVVLEKLETQNIDITSAYKNWVDIGFAISSKYGSSGRDYFHRVSRLSGKYDQKACDEQYSKCLNNKGSGVNISTFFHYAKEHGITHNSKKNESPSAPTTKAKIPEKAKTKFELAYDYIDDNYDIRYNTALNDFEAAKKGSKQFDTLNENNLYIELKMAGYNVSMSDMITMLKSDLLVDHYDPFERYFEELGEWTEKEPDYITQLAQYVQVKDRERFDTQFKKFLVRSVACALVDGAFNKQALILVHDQQSSGKSTFCRWLCPPKLIDHFTENLTLDKDGHIALCENFLINLDELASLSKYEINQLKSVFSASRVKVRKPYDRKPVNLPRRCNFLGSTNKSEFLADETGSVRWLCFEIESIDFNYSVDLDIDMIWKQAFVLFKSNFKYEMTPEEVTENEAANSQYQISTPEMELIQKYMLPGTKDDHHVFWTATDIKQFLHFQVSTGFRLNNIVIGKALKILKIDQVSKFNGVHSVKGYYLKGKNNTELKIHN